VANCRPGTLEADGFQPELPRVVMHVQEIAAPGQRDRLEADDGSAWAQVPPVDEPMPEAGDREPLPARAATGRLQSLDAFRGLTILGMLLVNNMALDTATPPQFNHAGWNQGVHFADLIYPWFLFIVGVAIPWSAAAARANALPEWRYVLKVLGRALTLILLGCLIDSSLAREPVFDLGVLQLIGIAYGIGALLCALPWERRLLAAALLLVAHWAALRFLPVPGAGVGVFTESHNLVRHLDRVYLQPYRLQGLLSIVPTAAMVLIGTVVGDLLRRRELDGNRKVAWLLLSGLGLVALGGLWNLSLPFNKPVWTASYIVYTAGLGVLLLGLLYLLIDVNGWRAWAFPLVVAGMNAIFAYVVPILVKLHVLSEWTTTTSDGMLLPLQQAMIHACILRWGRIAGGWAYTLLYVGFWWLVLLYLYRRKLFLRV
jgi:predicted acyltransferase